MIGMNVWSRIRASRAAQSPLYGVWIGSLHRICPNKPLV